MAAGRGGGGRGVEGGAGGGRWACREGGWENRGARSEKSLSLTRARTHACANTLGALPFELRACAWAKQSRSCEASVPPGLVQNRRGRCSFRQKGALFSALAHRYAPKILRDSTSAVSFPAGVLSLLGMRRTPGSVSLPPPDIPVLVRAVCLSNRHTHLITRRALIPGSRPAGVRDDASHAPALPPLIHVTLSW